MEIVIPIEKEQLEIIEVNKNPVINNENLVKKNLKQQPEIIEKVIDKSLYIKIIADLDALMKTHNNEPPTDQFKLLLNKAADEAKRIGEKFSKKSYTSRINMAKARRTKIEQRKERESELTKIMETSDIESDSDIDSDSSEDEDIFTKVKRKQSKRKKKSDIDELKEMIYQLSKQRKSDKKKYKKKLQKLEEQRYNQPQQHQQPIIYNITPPVEKQQIDHKKNTAVNFIKQRLKNKINL